MRWKAFYLVALGCLATLVACTGGRPEPEGPRLVLLYATCTLNKSFLEPYDPRVVFTPHLAGLDDAVVFRRHMTEAGQSGTAFAALFSGRQAEHHGIFRHPTPLGAEVELIGEAFARAGYEVATWLEHGMASADLGYAQGAGTVHDGKLTAEDPGFRELLARLAADPQAHALAVTAFTVTHGPYQPGPLDTFCRRHPAECAARADPQAFDFYAEFYRKNHAFLSYDFPAVRERSGMGEADLERLVEAVDLLYRANVAYLDHLFGSVVEAIRGAGLWDETVLVFTADHGETLYRDNTHFKWTHGHQLAPEVLEVPLLVRAPGLQGGSYDGVSRSIDVFPTLAGLAGIEVPAGEGWGVDLSAALRGLAPPPRLTAYSHTSLIAEPVLEASRKWGLFHRIHPRIDPELMWVQRRDRDRLHQLRRTVDGEPEWTTFDLARDPQAMENVYDPGDPADRAAAEDLRAYRERLIAAYREHAARQPQLDRAEQEERLRALSYID